MINNTDLIWINDPIYLHLGGSLSFEGENLMIYNSFFEGNNGESGGGILLEPSEFTSSSDIIIQSNWFKQNYAYCGGAIGFLGRFDEINAFLYHNYFLKNWAISKSINF